MPSSVTGPGLFSIEEVSTLIPESQGVMLAGEEALLQKLPKGEWIGGSIPYFMTKAGGITSKDRIFVQPFPPFIQDITIKSYSLDTIHTVLSDAPENGFSVIIIPAGSEIHASYARNAAQYADMFLKPLVGWVAGVHLNDLNKLSPRVFNGREGTSSDQEAVVLHATLAPDMMAQVDIINLFAQGEGPTFYFPETGFQVQDCLIDGKQTNLADYLLAQGVDSQLPLVANYFGAQINVSFQEIDGKNHLVHFYAPVFEGVEYRLAQPIADYVSNFESILPKDAHNITFSCNCILNYLYAHLEGKKLGSLYGPVTFGEVGYQLLNQTFVYLSLTKM